MNAFSHFRFISLEKKYTWKERGEKNRPWEGHILFREIEIPPRRRRSDPQKKKKRKRVGNSFPFQTPPPSPSIMEKEKKYSGVITPKTC